MLKITNTYDDRDLTVVSRDTVTGRDGEAVNVGPGGSAEIEFDGEHQVVLSTRGRNPGEDPIPLIPQARVVESGDDGKKTAEVDTRVTLNDASDDDVRAEIQAMVDEKSNLTQGGKPELPVLNERLAAKGFGPVDGKRRDALLPTPATT